MTLWSFDSFAYWVQDTFARAGHTVPRARAKLRQRPLKSNTSPQQRRLLVDVSAIHKHDARTGIQRVVRALLNYLLLNPPKGFVVQPIAATKKKPYRCIAWDPSNQTLLEVGQKISPEPGDVFLGLDLSAHIIPAQRRQLSNWKRHGTVFHFVIYDLLPLHHPEWFSKKLVGAFRKWIVDVAILADNAICISQAVADDLEAWFEVHYGLKRGTVATCVLPMGHDMSATAPSHGYPAGFDTLISNLKKCKTALVVGTLEPRKGHAFILDAFDLLWDAGHSHNLVIIGRLGWASDALAERLDTHPQSGRNLFWIKDASDDALADLYQVSDGVILASWAEGFGLPLIEARGYGKRILARDLPVFREQSDSNVAFFKAADSEEFSVILQDWLMRVGHDSIESTKNDAISTWKDSGETLTQFLSK